MLYSSKMMVNTEQLRFDQKELEIEKEKRHDLSQTRAWPYISRRGLSR